MVVGGYIKHQVGIANAASENVTVASNNQISTIDQGTPQIIRTSTVTVKDTTASVGYSLSARIENNSVPNSIVTIGSASSTICTLAAPCVITGDPTPAVILETDSNNATQVAGDTTQWTVTISLPANTPLGNYLLDIAYAEDPIASPSSISGMTYLQDLALLGNENICADTPDRTRTTLIDRRNGQQYFVEKIGTLCWMETNLRYAGDGSYDSAWGYADDRYATTTALAANTQNLNDNARPLTMTTGGYFGGTSTNAYAVAGVIDPHGSTDYTNITASGGFYGYLYNWCAAMGGQANSCNRTSTTGFNTGASICPAGWRLPTGGAGGDFWALNAAVNSGSTTSDVGLRNNFLAVYAGFSEQTLINQGSFAYYWSSTVYSAIIAYNPYFYASLVDTSNHYNKNSGFAVRCVY